MVGSTSAAPGRVFMSYRRDDTDFPASWLYERLIARFGRDRIFKDVDSIELGEDFVEVIANAVESCDVLLALIGDRWSTITNEGGQRRLDDPNDFVRLEIEAALQRNVRVIPILVGATRMPQVRQLPASLAKLVRRQALQLDPNRFESDIGRLLRVLDKTLVEKQAEREAEAKARREAETRARREAQARAEQEAEAQAKREAEEQAHREAVERRLSAIDEMAKHLRSGEVAAAASAEEALRRLANDTSQRVAQAATSLLADWEASKQAQQEAEAKAQQEAEAKAQQEAEAKAQQEAEEQTTAQHPATAGAKSRWRRSSQELLVAGVSLVVLVSAAIYIASSNNGPNQSPASTINPHAPRIIHQGTKTLSAGDYIDLQTGEITTSRTSQSELTACCANRLIALRSARSTTGIFVAPSDVKFDTLERSWEIARIRLLQRIRQQVEKKNEKTEIRPKGKGIMFVPCEGDTHAKVQVVGYLPGGKVNIRWITYWTAS